MPNLPYDYKDLEPIISRDIMQIHHSKHHAAYVNNYNIAEEKLQQAVTQGNYFIVIQNEQIVCHFSSVSLEGSLA